MELLKSRMNGLVDECTKLSGFIAELEIPGITNIQATNADAILLLPQPCHIQCVMLLPVTSIEGDKRSPESNTTITTEDMLKTAKNLLLEAIISGSLITDMVMVDELISMINSLDQELANVRLERAQARLLDSHIPSRGHVSSMVTQLDALMVDTTQLLSYMRLVAPETTRISSSLDAEKVRTYVSEISSAPLSGFAAQYFTLELP